ncbi:GPI ethanolamine phosphate transferase 1 [Cercospora beticola]|uniref:GPI ethanolamine phosphate transferase 1 n=1 Tax=Cercospora beticola TaxID=122368 RepID=A0A2G5HMS2_CERBT|nr:GPI ethanolamine phosphate transferase 1 [Cercospora beticola]PIA93798.1 GPI ethanolamine phosphate transferase 1 [Cercospora beticola]WPB01565.1 Glycosyl phosphatidyl inositol anchor synthesis [Cercospora beticola]
MARLGRVGFLGVAVVFHLIYVYSIFDIYFVSPIVRGMRAYRVEDHEAPAKRLVLYVGDGLRADKAFQFFPDPSRPANESASQDVVPMAPFLRSRVLEHGTFGVSHTRVPTESRPGHVALIAGLYEDVAAVTTGWKLNPVNFDSVFNRSRHTWSWGSPDILPMFSTGAVPGRVEDATYGHEFEDFSKDATELDYWVFDRVKKLFKDAETDPALNNKLRQDKLVFFLHLLGLDTTGHAYRPYSQEYLRNIQIVDKGVQEITEVINNFYDDDETAFVFTADHGMSDWGSHGDGHPDNTRTPLIAWGSGVAKPQTVKQGKAPGHEDGFSSDWRFDHVQRHDVAQADVAALMAYLAGLEFPVNSVGELPLSFLDASDEEKAKALLVNAKEILEMYHVKEREKMATVLRYKPYSGFADAEHSVENRIASIEQLIRRREYQKAIDQSDELIQLGLAGLRYLQTYAWLFLRTLVTAGYLGWIAFAFTTAVDVHILDGKVDVQRTPSLIISSVSILVGLYSLLVFQASPITYYAYALFPVLFWEEVFARRQALIQGKNKLFANFSKGEVTKLAANVLGYLALLEVMVQSYYHREIYTILYLVATAWPLLYGTDFVKSNGLLCTTWALSCASMSIFTLLPANKVESSGLILLGGFLILLIGVLYIAFEQSLLVQSSTSKEDLEAAEADYVSRLILGAQVGLVALAMLVTRSSVASLQAKTGLPLGTQILGWITLVTSLILPFAHALRPRNHYLHRLAIIFLAFGPVFIILTISYEGLFYFAIAITLVSWVRLEHRIHQRFGGSSADTTTAAAKTSSSALGDSTHAASNGDASHANGLKKKLDVTTPLAPALDAAQQREKAAQTGDYRSLTLSDARICLFFLFFLQSGFYSTGNIASVSSFSLDAVYRLIPVFDPFSQGALLVLKLLAPFALISANLGILTRRLKLRGGSLFAIVMGIGDYLTLRFFWEVRDEGSWLEIGESISMFIIASVLCIFVAGLEALSEVFVRGVEFDDDVVKGTNSSNGTLNGKPNGVVAASPTAAKNKKNK